MAINEKDYVKSDAKVKAAKDKLSSAKADLAKVQGSNLPGAKERAAEFKKAVDAAQTALDTASKDASAYFAANKEQIQAAETKKQATKTAAQRAASAESIKSITESGYLTPEQVAAINKAQSDFQSVKGPGATISGQPSIDEKKIQVEDFATTLKNSRKELKGMDDTTRLALANKLIAAGYPAPKTGTYTDQLWSQYQAAISAAQGAYKTNKEFPTLQTFLDDKAKQQAALNAAGGGAGGTKYDRTVFGATTAANYISNEIKQFLGRDATAAEINNLTAKLQKEQNKHPDVVTTDAQGNRTTKRDFDAIGFLDSEIKKLPEYKKKQLGKAQASTDKVISTARDNGIDATQGQIDTWAKRIQNGEDIATIQHEIRNLAAIGRSDVIAKQLAAGNDLATIVSPYKQYAQQILEIPMDQLSINDPAIKMAIAGEKPMSLTDYQNALRQDVRWQYTNNAKTAVSDSVQKVLQDFGFMG